MTDYRVPAEDVRLATEALWAKAAAQGHVYDESESINIVANIVLDAVLPAHDRALALALAEAWDDGDEWDDGADMGEWLRRKAEQIGGDDD